MNHFNKLQQLIQLLLDPEQGCRWLSAQDFKTIAPYSIEEAFELVEAIEREDYPAVCDELADLLYHLLIYTELGKRIEQFDLAEVIDLAIAKQEQRRDLTNLTKFESAEEAHADWREQKRQRQRAENPNRSILAEIPVSMPALVRSKKIQDRAGHVGFDWDNATDVMEKLKEEVAELEHEMTNGDRERMLDELGDILFSAVNLGRHLQIDAEQALRSSNNKFQRRFQYIEQQTALTGQDIAEMSFADLLDIWEQAKAQDPN